MSRLISPGRNEGWLTLSIPAALPVWARLYDIDCNGIKFAPVPGHEDRGTAIIVDQLREADDSSPLLRVSKDLILSREHVRRHSHSDRHLGEVLEAVGEFAKTPRGAIMVFLLMQATLACPHVEKSMGVQGPFTEYIKFFPEEILPTFWSEEETGLLRGTSLEPALKAKMTSLYREYADLSSATESIKWCRETWWDEVDGLLSFDDWKHVDAMYRTRGLDFPGIGHVMVPCVDMANHSSTALARFETDSDGNATLLLCDHQQVQPGQEVTISYGDDKGACEMLFSYGFIDNDWDDAKALFLDLSIPDDDPLKKAKLYVSQDAPGVRIHSKGATVSWDSDFVWLVCVNEEDGLDFGVQETTDGERELKSFWKEHELSDTSRLRDILQSDQSWPVYLLRATCIIQDRVALQVEELEAATTSDDGAAASKNIREACRSSAHRLQKLELALLRMSYDQLERQKHDLSDDPVVQSFLKAMQNESADDDFS